MKPASSAPCSVARPGRLRRLLLALPLAVPLCLCGAAAQAEGAAVGVTDAAAVRAVMMKAFDRPDAPLKVDPVVIDKGFALAGWLQGERGGRALLRKSAHGWAVHVCGGDGLKDLRALGDAGLEASTARRLVAALETEEKKLPAELVRRFALFGQNVVVGPDHGASAAGGHAAPGHPAASQASPHPHH